MHRLAGLVAAFSLAGCAAIPDARPPMDSGAVEIPERLAILADREKHATRMGTDQAAFHDWLRSRAG